MISLSHDDILEALEFYLESRGGHVEGPFEFEMNGGKLSAKAKGILDEDDEEESETQDRDEKTALIFGQLSQVRKPRAILCKASSDVVDVLTGERIPAGARVIWLAIAGVTRAPLDVWPDVLRRKFHRGDLPSAGDWPDPD